MNKKKLLSILSLFMVISLLTPLFAQSRTNRGNRPRLENNFQRNAQMQRPQRDNFPPMPRGNRNENSRSEFDIMGTISKVDEKNNLIIMQNIDKEEITIHINPLSKIIVLPEQNKMNGPINLRYNCKQNVNDSNAKKIYDEKFLSLKDVKEGMWIALTSFDTKTDIIEARKIFVK